MILAARASGAHRQRGLDVADDLFRVLIHANQRVLVVVRFAVDVEDLLEMRDKPGSVRFGNAEPFATPRLETIFLRHFRTVSGHTDATTCKRHNSSTNKLNVQR